MNELSKNAKFIQNKLSENNIETKVLELPSSTKTAKDAAFSIGCKIEQIAKSLIFKTEKNEALLILVSGSNRVLENIIEEIIKEKVLKADADFTREVTGFAIGGIPPIGHKNKIKTFIDNDLLKNEIVWAAAGNPNAVFSIEAKDLISLTNGIIVNFN